MREGLPDGAAVAIMCGDWSETTCALANMAIALAFSGLTGIKAFIPIFFVAVGSKFMPEDFPLHLEDGSWLDSWPAIISLGVLLVVEVVGDCIPGLDEIMDAVMMALKPIMAIIIAVAPFYGTDGSSQALLFQGIAVVNAGLLSSIMALIKAVETIATDVGSAGACAPVRSSLETLGTTVLTLLIITVGVALAIFCLVAMISLIIGWIIYRKMKGKPLLPRCWCCRNKFKKPIDDDSDSELEESDSEDEGYY